VALVPLTPFSFICFRFHFSCSVAYSCPYFNSPIRSALYSDGKKRNLVHLHSPYSPLTTLFSSISLIYRYPPSSPSVPFYYRRLRLKRSPVASFLDGCLAMSTTAENRPESTPSRPSPAPSTAGSTGTSGITVRGGQNGHMSFRRCVVIFPFAVVVG
jgi:hypothetical protein